MVCILPYKLFCRTEMSFGCKTSVMLSIEALKVRVPKRPFCMRFGKRTVCHWSKNHYTHNFDCWGINSAIAHISYTTLIVEELICVMRVCLCCLFVFSSTISEKGNCTTMMLGELISNYTHITYTTTIVGELIV